MKIPSIQGVAFSRKFTSEGISPLCEIDWAVSDAVLTDAQGNIVFEQKNVKYPKSWSQTSVNIVASKYFHGTIGTPERESGVDDLIRRVVTTISNYGANHQYFASKKDRATFEAELSFLLLDQRASFNSPVWFSAGCDTIDPDDQRENWHFDDASMSVVFKPVGYSRPQCSACFINSVSDSMQSILKLAMTEGILFQGGSGTGSNLSNIRGSMELLRGGGVASGPLSFMRGYDAFAGAIKSGGKTRRAAKMVILNADHPDIEEFIACKGKEEAKAKALMSAGYDGSGLDSEAFSSVFFQNANNSVRVSDAFMELASNKNDLSPNWEIKARTTGNTVRTVNAHNLLYSIAKETWQCGDPGLQFDDQINAWHTCPLSGRINASNPCSEYMFLDDSACNLASINLLKYFHNGVFDVEGFEHTVRVLIVAQDILVDLAGYPTQAIAVNSHNFRPLGLGFANLGGLLMNMGVPYDSDAARDCAAAITALMTGTAYCMSAEMAGALPKIPSASTEIENTSTFGSFPGFPSNWSEFVEVILKHESHLSSIVKDVLPGTLQAAKNAWTDAIELGSLYGFRNAQTTLLAPNGTTGFAMDVASTGVEPMLALLSYKKLVGGGHMTMACSAVPSALTALGYTTEEVAAINDYVATEGTIEGAPMLREEHLPIFDCSLRPIKGTRSISWMGHLSMMAAIQPFLSGAISKTVNLPQDATVEQIMDAYIAAWRMGLKAIAIYRDGSKGIQPVALSKASTQQSRAITVPAQNPNIDLNAPPKAVRNRLPSERSSVTHKFNVGGHEGYITVGLYPNGQPGEIFVKIAKEGSTISGMMDAFATAISIALQSGVSLSAFVDKFSYMRFEPSGWTGNEKIGFARSIMDYIFRWLNLRFVQPQQLEIFANNTSSLPTPQQLAPEMTVVDIDTVGDLDGDIDVVFGPLEASSGITDTVDFGDAPYCPTCGNIMYRSGKCFSCPNGCLSSGCS